MYFNKPYYGAHISIKKGIISAIDEIIQMGGNMIQIFISNPISTKFNIDEKKFNETICKQIKNKLLETDSKLVIHLPYVINLAKPLCQKPENCWWIKMICDQLIVSESIGSIGCVVHVGKSLNLTETEALENMFNAFVYIIEFMHKHSMETKIILETAAGQGSELITTKNNSLEDFANFYNKFNLDQKKYIKICVDTCHIFAAGYDIQKPIQISNFFSDFDTMIGINNMSLIHLNDSKCGCGSCVDRHENIGFGKIGKHALKHFIRYGIFYKIPIILETPNLVQTEIDLISQLKNDVENIK